MRTQPPKWWVRSAVSAGIKRSGREADHTPPTCARIIKRVTLPPLPLITLRRTSHFEKFILSETLACFLPGRAKDLSAPLYLR